MSELEVDKNVANLRLGFTSLSNANCFVSFSTTHTPFNETGFTKGSVY